MKNGFQGTTHWSSHGKIGAWITSDCPRNCGHPIKDAMHIFQCQKVDETWDKIKKIFLHWEECNKESPNQALDILHNISLWCKVQLTQTPHPIPNPVANSFKKQSILG